VHQHIAQGSSSSTTPPTTNVTVDVTGSTKYQLPQRFNSFATALPFTPTFNASTIFAGQEVAVLSDTVASGVANADAVMLVPQTVHGTINSITQSGAFTVFNITLPSAHWLANITGKSTVVVYVATPTQAINKTAPAVGSDIRFNGYLFNNAGTLTLVAVVQADAPGTPII
jgi:hypothetical protein